MRGKKEDKHILFLVPYPINKAPSQRLKFEQYYPYLQSNGYDISVRPFISKNFWDIVYKKGHFVQKAFYTLAGYADRFAILFSLRKYDVVYIHLWVTPLGPPFFEMLVCRLAKKVIYDIDDLVYLSENKSEANKLIAWLKGRNKPIFLMKQARHIITCTPYLDNFVRQFNRYTTDISSTINTDKYLPKTSYDAKERKIILGWSGSYSTAKYLRLLEPVVQRLVNEGIAIKLLVMGDENFSLSGVDVEALAWSEEYEVDTIRRFDIGLYPLPNEQWVHGKSGLKALQYMALGVPTVATAIGANYRIISDGENGFLVKNTEEWFLRLKSLILDASLRKKLGQAAVQVVQERYSIHANRDTYLSIINGVVSDK